MQVRIRTVPAQVVVYSAYEGPLDKVGPIFDHLQGWMRAHDGPDGPVTGVFIETRQPLDDSGAPQGAPDGKAEAWIALPPGDEGKRLMDAARDDDEAGLGAKQVGAARVAAALFEGHPLDLIVLQDQLRRFLRKKGYRLGDETRFVYLEADFTRINQWKTEVQVPIESKGTEA